MLSTSAPRVWAYARYSTEKQTPKSTADQLTDCRSFCAAQGWSISEERSDEEISGFTDHRPAYQDLCRAIEGHRVDIVVAENVDRLVRDAEHAAALDKLCDFYDVAIHTVQEGRVNSLCQIAEEPYERRTQKEYRASGTPRAEWQYPGREERRR